MPQLGLALGSQISGGKLTIYDTDALTYINAVQAADGESLENGVKIAINDFVLGCKSDGIWSAIKASCILAGARTLSGALIPLAGTAPTNNNFVSADYNRKTGLIGNGSTKYLNSNRNNNQDPQDNKHIASYATTGNTRDVVRVLIGTLVGNNIGACTLFSNATNFNGRISYGSPPAGITQAGLINGLQGASRNNASTVDYYFNNTSGSQASVSSIQTSSDTNIFANGNLIPSSFGDARISFYSIGTSINLALLDARTTTLINTLASVLP
jgi:hypothetical protein